MVDDSKNSRRISIINRSSQSKAALLESEPYSSMQYAICNMATKKVDFRLLLPQVTREET